MWLPEVLIAEQRLDALLAAVAEAERVLILPHNYPDPDAIASAVALQRLLAARLAVEVSVGYRGIVGRAENRALLRYLDHPMKSLSPAVWRQPVTVALVDTQPGVGNNALPRHIMPAVVIDHHPLSEQTAQARFVDVRTEYGATSTILTEYLQAAGITLDKSLATALFYGIKTDTMGLTRRVTEADTAAYFYLLPLADPTALVEIERAEVPADYFKSLSTAVRSARVYDTTLVSYLGKMAYPDLTAEMADLLLRLEGIYWVICMGVYGDALILSVRARVPPGRAGELAQSLMGDMGTAGGHGMMAGGQRPLQENEDPEQVATELIRRALEVLDIPPQVTVKTLA